MSPTYPALPLQALQQAPSVFVAYMDVLTALAAGEKGARAMYQQVRRGWVKVVQRAEGARGGGVVEKGWCRQA